jgi:hypothetical protein
MKTFFSIFMLVMLLTMASIDSYAQCSICTRTAQQLGEKPAKGLNAGILYLAFTPLVLIGFIGYKFYKRNSQKD